MHPFNNEVLYPRRESESVIPQPPAPSTSVSHTYDQFIPSTYCQTIQASSPVELPMITAILGHNEIYAEGSIETVISQAQCQKLELTYNYIYPGSSTSQTPDVDDFIFADSGFVMVDVGESFLGANS